MEYIRGNAGFSIGAKTAVTLGKFDGVHRGHQKLIGRIIEKKAQGSKAVIVTFDIPPVKLLTGGGAGVLCTNEERKHRLESIGVDYLLEYRFTREMAAMEPETFVKEILVKNLNAGYVAVGPDFHFGSQRKGNGELLKKLGMQYDFEVDIIEKEMYGGREISSSYIKELLARGEMELAAELLGYPYTVSGTILDGRKLGRTMGIPTTNLMPELIKLLPPNGVYATKTLLDGRELPGITNIGYKPTVGAEEQKGVETYLFEFDEDIYGKEISVQLYAFQRLERKFASLEELKAQIQKDIAFGKEYFRG